MSTKRIGHRISNPNAANGIDEAAIGAIEQIDRNINRIRIIGITTSIIMIASIWIIGGIATISGIIG